MMLIHKFLRKLILVFKIINFRLPLQGQNALIRIKDTIFPPRILIKQFYTKGIVFEVPTDMEYNRAISLGGEQEFMGVVLNSIQPDDVFYDIGSCIGLYAIHAAKLGAKVVAFEPDPSYRKRLYRNIRLNKSSSAIQVVDWAVSNQTGEIRLFTDGVDGFSPSLVAVGERGSVIVKTNTIDQALASGELSCPTTIKIDIEGAEVWALEGMIKLLLSPDAPRLIFVEIHETFLPNFNSSAEYCQQLLESCGYYAKATITRSEQLQVVFARNYNLN